MGRRGNKKNRRSFFFPDLGHLLDELDAPFDDEMLSKELKSSGYYGHDPVRKITPTEPKINPSDISKVRVIRDNRMNCTVQFGGNFYAEPDVMLRFNEYARAALSPSPSEIGGFARVVKEGNDWIWKDIIILPQSAHSVYFEINEDVQNDFMHKLVAEGKMDQLHEWTSIIHSHPPGMSPEMSGTDIDHLEKFAQTAGGFAFSIIASANKDVTQSRYAVHYHQTGPVPLTIKNMAIQVRHPLREDIETEVKDLIKPRHSSVSHGRNGYQGQFGYGSDLGGPRAGGRTGIPRPYSTPAPQTRLLNPVGSNRPTDLDSIADEEQGMLDILFKHLEEMGDSDEHVYEAGDQILIKLNENSSHGINDEDRATLAEMDGQDFYITAVDPEKGLLINGFYFDDHEVELIDSLSDLEDAQDELQDELNELADEAIKNELDPA